MGKGSLIGSNKELWDMISEEIIHHWENFKLIQDDLEMDTNSTVNIKIIRTKLESKPNIAINVVKFLIHVW